MSRVIIIFICLLLLISVIAFIFIKLNSKSSSSSSSSTPPDPNSQGSGMAGVYIPSWSYYRNGSGKFPNYENGVVSIPNLPANLDFITYAFVLFDSSTGNLTWGGTGTGGNVFNSDGTTINTAPTEKFDFDTVKYIGSSNIKYRFISVGGYNFSQVQPSPWSSLINDVTSITNLANQLVNMCKIYNLNGVDIDWELPKTSIELDTFMKTAGPIFQKAKITITLATDLNPITIDNIYNFSNIDQYFSWYNLMSYDIHGNFPGTTTFGANTDLSYIQKSVDKIIGKGINPSKLSLGLASYGRYTRLTNYDSTISALGQPCTLIDQTICLSETGSNLASYSGYTSDCLSGPYTKTVGYLSYYEILDLLSSITPTPTPVYDSNTESHYVVLQKSDGTTMAISYDTPNNIINKTKYALNKNLKGIFLWQLADDDFQNGFPITNSAISTVKNKTPPTINPTRTLYNIGLCGVPWSDTKFTLGKVNTCTAFGDPTTVGNGTENCFGMNSCKATYNSACQIGSTTGNISYQLSTDGNINDFLNKTCGSVVYQGATNADHFYEDYVKSGRILACDCDGTQYALSPDCSGNSNMGQCLKDGFGNAYPQNAMICTDSTISNCKLTCSSQFANNSDAFNEDGKNFGTTCSLDGCPTTSICAGENPSAMGGADLPFCKNGQPTTNLTDKVYVKCSSGKTIPLRPIDCQQYCK